MEVQAADSEWHVALVIQNSIHRYGVEGMINSLPRTESVGHLDSGSEYISGDEGERIDIVLAASADLEQDEAREAIRKLCAHGPKLLLLVDGPEALDMPWMATCGAQGFLDWSELEPKVLADAVEDVMADKFSVSTSLAQRLVGRAAQTAGSSPHWGPAGATLTPRELQVLRLVAEGLSNKQVSRHLKISEHGVKRLVGNVLAKLNCPNRTLAVVRAMQDGLLTV